MPQPDAALVMLAAGRSSRFNGEKLSAMLDGRPVIERTMQVAEGAQFARRILVCRPNQADYFASDGWDIVTNADYRDGLSTSIRQGVAFAQGSERVVLILGDMPFVTADHLALLAGGEGVIFTRHPDGRPGCPAAFPPDAFARLQTLEGDRGAASLDFPDARLVDPSHPAMLADIDTPADLARAAEETKRAANR